MLNYRTIVKPLDEYSLVHVTYSDGVISTKLVRKHSVTNSAGLTRYYWKICKNVNENHISIDDIKNDVVTKELL